MNIKVFIGLVLGFVIGLGCSLLHVPVPAPPVISGSLLVIAMTSGYLLADKYLCKHRPKDYESHSGGPVIRHSSKDKNG